MLFALGSGGLLFTNTGFAKNCATEYCFGYKYLDTWVTVSKDNYETLKAKLITNLRKIHRIVFELEKRKIIDDKKVHKEERDKRN